MSEYPWSSPLAQSSQEQAEVLLTWFEQNGPKRELDQALLMVESLLSSADKLKPQTQLELLLLRSSLEESMGFFERCARSCQQARTLYTPQRSPQQRAKVEYMDVLAALGGNDLKRSATPLAALRQIAADTGDLDALFYLSFCEGALAQQRGEHAPALEHMWRARSLARQINRRDMEMIFAAVIARQCIYLGQHAQARRLTQQCITPELETPYHKTHRLLLHGLACAELPDPSSARKALTQAYDEALLVAMPLFANHAAIYLAWLSLVHQRPQDALSWLSKAAVSYPRYPSSTLEDALHHCAEVMLHGATTSPDSPAPQWTPRQKALIAIFAGDPLDPLEPVWVDELPDMDWIDMLLFIVKPVRSLELPHAPRFTLNQDHSALSCDDAVHDLRRRGALRKILGALVEAQHQQLGPLDTPTLFELGWPDPQKLSDNGLRRVYTELYRLKALGLELEYDEGGYKLLTPVALT